MIISSEMLLRIMLKIVVLLLLITAASGAENNSSQEIENLQGLLNSYHFIYKPQIDVFDCVDMAVADYKFLKSQGYESLIVILDDHTLPNGTRIEHSVALARLSGGWAGVETKTSVIDTSKSIGAVIGIDPAYIRGVYATPEEVYAYDVRGPPSITGDVIEPNVESNRHNE